MNESVTIHEEIELDINSASRNLSIYRNAEDFKVSLHTNPLHNVTEIVLKDTTSLPKITTNVVGDRSLKYV